MLPCCPQAWYDEVKDWPADNVGAFDTASPVAATGVVGHYTQVVWAKTTKVGCGWVGHIDSTKPTMKYKQVRRTSSRTGQFGSLYTSIYIIVY